MSRAVRVLVVVIGSAVTWTACLPNLCGCSPPTDVMRTVLLERSVALGAQAATSVDVIVPTYGTTEATIDWTHASNAVVVALTIPSCAEAEEALSGACPSPGTRPSLGSEKPKKVSAATPPGAIRVWIANRGASAESIGMQVTLTQVIPLNR